MAREPDGFHVVIKAPKTLGEGGRFTSQAQKELYRRNREYAHDLQEQVAMRIQDSIKRKGVSSHRLVKVTRDSGNIKSDRYYMGVGNIGFLNTSIAKYWRTAEEGTAKSWTKRSFTSLPLQGIWGMNVGGWARPQDPWIYLSGNRIGGSARQEMYMPFRKGKGARLPIFYPKHDTTPMHAYKAVYENPAFTRHHIGTAQKFFETLLNIRPGGHPDA